jgi:hypothetical protein
MFLLMIREGVFPHSKITDFGGNTLGHTDAAPLRAHVAARREC